MNSIAFEVENEKHFSSRIQKFFRRYQVSSILKKCNAYKEQGFSVMSCLVDMGSVIFSRTNNLLGQTYIAAHAASRKILMMIHTRLQLKVHKDFQG